MADADEAVLAGLRRSDPDRYVAALLLTGKARQAVAGLYAFNADIASVRERVQSPAPGEIRLQWWKDALLGQGHGEVRQNPAAAALLDAIAAFNLPVGSLQRLLEARRFDLYDDPMPDLQSFEGYAGETVSTLYQLTAMVLNDGVEVASGDAAGHLGVAHALIGHLRAFGYQASTGRIFLPWSVFAAHGVKEGDIFAGRESPGLEAALAQLAEIAEVHLGKALPAIRALPSRLRPAFALHPVLRAQLRALASTRSSPYSPPHDEASWQKIGRMTLFLLTNR